jgi:hypothetical protein
VVLPVKSLAIPAAVDHCAAFTASLTAGFEAYEAEVTTTSAARQSFGRLGFKHLRAVDDGIAKEGENDTS